MRVLLESAYASAAPRTGVGIYTGLLADALRGAGVPLAERFAASAAHFEGWGVLKVLEATADADALHALEEQDELPHE